MIAATSNRTNANKRNTDRFSRTAKDELGKNDDQGNYFGIKTF